MVRDRCSLARTASSFYYASLLPLSCTCVTIVIFLGVHLLPKSLGDAVIICLHSEPGTPRVLPRGRVSPDSAQHPASFLAALETPPVNPQSPSVREKELSPAAEAAVAAARNKGTPGLVPYVPECLAGTLVEAFGVLSAADATDKRDRYECMRVVRTLCTIVVVSCMQK